MNETEPTPPRQGRVVHPRLPADIYDRVQAFAERDRRTMTNALIYLIERGLEVVESGPADPDGVHLR